VLEKVLSGEPQAHCVVETLSQNEGDPVLIEVSMTPLVKAGEVASIHMIARDLRDRRNRELMDRQAEKMDALRHFVSGTAQELKNPLMGLAKRVDILLKKYADRDFEYISYREFRDMIATMETVRDQIHYCHETVQRLTAMGQKQAGIKRGHCSVNQVISGVMKDKAAYLDQYDIQTRVILGTADIDARISVVDLIQILNNLVDNAVQSMPSGGQLTIQSSLAARGGDVVIEVKDQGIGIPKDQLEHIFEPFFTTKSRGLKKNSGLGLPIVHSLVTACQGEMQVSSSLRRGTTVRVFLPIYRMKRKKG